VEGELGKRLFLPFVVILMAGVFSNRLPAMPGSSDEPLFVYLQATFTDPVNLDLAEDRLRHLLPMLDKFRQEHRQAHVSATLLFSGAASDALERRNQQTHIVDFVKDYLRRGVIEVGYDGSNETAYDKQPVMDLSGAKKPADRWLVREKAADELLTETRDPLTGAAMPGKAGGLKRMQQVFGEAAYVGGVAPIVDLTEQRPGTAITHERPVSTAAVSKEPVVPTRVPEIGADTEVVHALLPLDRKAILAGLPEDNPAQIAGFGGGEAGFEGVVSPAPDTSPEVYWQDNVLRLSEVSNTSEESEYEEHDFGGLTADGLQDDLGELNRSRIQVVRVILADERYYLQHSLTKDEDYILKYAYSHPDNPKLPADALQSKADVDAFYAKEQAALAWLTDDFMPANPGSHFVSNAELARMAGPSAGYAISVSALRTAISETLAKWGNNTFPMPYLRVDDHYLSLADWFQVLTDALAELDRTGKLPESVRVVEVYGPDHTPMGHGPNVGEVTAGSVEHVCASLSGRLHDTSGDPPKNSIPTSITVGGINMNAAQFLRLMSWALVAPSPDTKIRVRMTYLFPEQAEFVPKTRPMSEMGASWTVKPVLLTLETSKASK
jgi:hypothetical protein